MITAQQIRRQLVDPDEMVLVETTILKNKIARKVVIKTSEVLADYLRDLGYSVERTRGGHTTIRW